MHNLLMNFRTAVLVAVCLLSIGAIGCKSSSTELAPQVAQYIGQLNGFESYSTSLPDFYFRKDTLKVNGALIIGNGGPNIGQAACTTSNTVALVLAKIDHFDDIGPCSNGGELVRAVLKN